MPRPLRCDHDDIDLSRWLDGVVVDGETVAEKQRLTLGEVVADIGLVNAGSGGVRDGEEDDVGALDGLGIAEDFEAFRFGSGLRGTSLVEADDDVHAAVFQVEGVGVALGTEADDGEGLTFEVAEIGVITCVNFCGHVVGTFE